MVVPAFPRVPVSVIPNKQFSTARHSQEAEPVYQLQPPRPGLSPAYISPQRTYGSHLYISKACLSAHLYAGSKFISAWTPSDNILLAILSFGASLRTLQLEIIIAIQPHTAPCVYWPPFSRIPGAYPLMYPGFFAHAEKGGDRSLNIFASLSYNFS